MTVASPELQAADALRGAVAQVWNFDHSEDSLAVRSQRYADAIVPESHDAALLLLEVERDFELPAQSMSADKSAADIDAALTEQIEQTTGREAESTLPSLSLNRRHYVR